MYSCSFSFPNCPVTSRCDLGMSSTHWPALFSWDEGSWSSRKESAYNAGDLSSLPVSRRSLKEGNGNPFQYYCLENLMDRGTWRATVYGVAKSQTQLKWLSTEHAQWRIIKLVREHLEKSQIWATLNKSVCLPCLNNAVPLWLDTRHALRTTLFASQSNLCVLCILLSWLVRSICITKACH